MSEGKDMLELIINDFRSKNIEKKIFFNSLCLVNNPIAKKLDLNQYPPSLGEYKEELYDLTCSYCLSIAKKFNSSIYQKYSKTFWIRLYWWEVYKIITVIHDFRHKIKFLSEKYKNENIKVTILNSTKFNFKNELDFAVNLNIDMQEAILSSIIKIENPPNFKLFEKEGKIFTFNKKKGNRFRSFLLLNFKKIYFRARVGYGFNFFKIFILHIYLSLLKPKKKINFEYNFKLKKWNNYDKLIEGLISENSKSIENLIISKSKSNFKPGKIRFLNNVFTSSEFKVIDFLASEFGEILIGYQHGGTYSYWEKNSYFNLEFNLDYFLSWGISNKKNIIPFSCSPVASSIKYKNKKSTEKIEILIVGTRIPIIEFSSENRIDDSQKDDYLKTKFKLIKELSKEKKNTIYYRPYDSYNSFNYESHLLNYIPKEKIFKKNLHKNLGAFKLLIIDHPSTTFTLVMNRKIPCLIIWNPKHYHHKFSKKFNEILIKLKKANIYHENSESLISFIEKKNNNDIQKWWHSKEVLNIVNEFNSKFSKVKKNWFLKLLNIFKHLD